MFSAAVFSAAVRTTEKHVHETIGSAIAQILLGNQATLVREGVDFGVCEDYLFHSGPLFHRGLRGVAVAAGDREVLVISDRCDTWLSVRVHNDLGAVCAVLGSQLAIALSINDSLGSCAYVLLIGGRPARLFADDGGEQTEFGDVPELERQLRDDRKSNMDIVDEMARLLLPGPFTQSAFGYRFDLWGPSPTSKVQSRGESAS